MRRAVSAFCTLLMVGGGAVAVAAPAEAALVPVVTRLSSAAGPLTARAMTAYGSHLRAVSRVSLGAASASRIKHYGDTKITFVAPRSTRPGTVYVRMLRAGHWRSVARYTYVARPVVTRLSRSTSTLTGGSSTVISGRYLSTSPVVHFGVTRARVTRRTASALTVVVPPSLAGATSVVVDTPGGRSVRTTASRFTYTVPAAVNTSSYTPAPTTVTGTGVQWVSGGPDESDPAGTASTPWIVSVEPGTALPSVGDSYFLAPGGSVLPSGLVGSVSSIAAQRDGSTRLTINPTPLDDALDNEAIRYSSGPPAPAGSRRHSSAPSGLDFSGLNASAFDCKRIQTGDPGSFTGEVGLRIEGLHTQFYKSGGIHPGLDAWIAGQSIVYGKVEVSSALKCSLKPEWANARRKVLFLADGVTLSFGPYAEVEVSSAGTVSVAQTTHFMYGASKQGDSPVQYYRIAHQDAAKASGSASLGVKASIGATVQFGLLDRVGVAITADFYGEGTIALKTGPLRACADLSVGFEITVGLFLDLWVKRWDYTAARLQIEFAKLGGCTTPDGDVTPDTSPQITSDQLPDATVGESYSTVLGTADDRLGHWTLIDGALPPGLSLGDDGTVSGTPSGGIGTDHPVVRFIDENARVAEATLLLHVLPDAGLGGGDIQATLTWNSEADLDLHALEPSGNEIYYNNSGPSDIGGELDHDANAGCATVDPAPTENIHWPNSSAVSGEYDFAVVTYDTCGTADLAWRLVVRVDGVVQIDQTGSGDSGWYALTYGSPAGGAQVRRISAPAHHAPARGAVKH